MGALMYREHFETESGHYGTIIILADGATIELMSTLHIDGVGRWGWAVWAGTPKITEISNRGRHQFNELQLNGTATVCHYRIDELGHVVSVRVYQSTVDAE